ncbi:family 43 glycosylhydrolase [Mariniflexile ostreae]|uniref:Family 43 glycosylhydrolase n=1 Tax=Mariniflexile ostreae TaxID=1520892 RepID=A0ABV5FD55_9FLAO
MKQTKIIFLLFTIIAVKIQGQEKEISYPYTWTTETNPIVKHIYACDPSAKVFKDGTIWVFASHDADTATGYWSMKDYHTFSTKDLKTWTDHGVALSVDDISWATSHLWAPDACERNGKYYMYVPANHKIGVFVSDKPEGPYKDALGKPLVPIDNAIDPMVFIDDDNQAYLYFSRKGEDCFVVKLKENMTEIDGVIHELTNWSIRSTIDGDYNFVEGPFVHKYKNTYYMTYPAKLYKQGAKGNKEGDEVICYATSNSPMGPFEYKGIVANESGVHTIHQSVIKLKNDYYFFYHNGALAEKNGHSEYNKFRRSMCVNKLIHNKDGSLKLVEQKEAIFD